MSEARTVRGVVLAGDESSRFADGPATLDRSLTNGNTVADLRALQGPSPGRDHS